MVSVSEKVQPAAVAAAEEAAATAAEAAAAEPAAARDGRSRDASRRHRAAVRAAGRRPGPGAPRRRRSELRAHLVDHALRRPPRLERLGEARSPSCSVSRRARSKLTGPRSALTSCPRTRGTNRAFGERRLDRRRRGDAGDRIVDASSGHNRRASRRSRFLERLPVAADLEHVAAVREQVRIAAGDRGDQHRLAAW